LLIVAQIQLASCQGPASWATDSSTQWKKSQLQCVQFSHGYRRGRDSVESFIAVLVTGIKEQLCNLSLVSAAEHSCGNSHRRKLQFAVRTDSGRSRPCKPASHEVWRSVWLSTTPWRTMEPRTVWGWGVRSGFFLLYSYVSIWRLNRQYRNEITRS
jgi:hypothetical protein